MLVQSNWSSDFAKAASSRGIVTLGIIHPGGDAIDLASRTAAIGMTGVVLEGDFDPKVRAALADSKILTVELPTRARMRFDNAMAPVTGSIQGLWPGIQIEENGAAKAAPSGAPWIDTNTGCLRF